MTKSPHGWVRPDLDARLFAHKRAWLKPKHADSFRSPEFHQFITISRQYGCEGAALAHRLVDILNEHCRPSFAWVALESATQLSPIPAQAATPSTQPQSISH